jgi:DNA-directed RNA polymerase sigma subunit (sigma70/sigma32)
MQQLVSELSRPVVLSDRALRALAGVKDAHREHVRLHGGEPTLRELAAERGLSRDHVQSLMVAERKPHALEEPVGGEDEVSSIFGELLSDERAQDAYDDVPLRFGLDELPHTCSASSRTARAPSLRALRARRP